MENPITNPFIARNKNPVTKAKIITGEAGGPHPLIVQELCRRPTVQTMLSVQVSTLAPCLPKHFTTVDPVSRPFFLPNMISHNYCSLILSAGVSSLTVHHTSLPH